MTESHNQPPSDGELREMFARCQGPGKPSPMQWRRKRIGPLVLAVFLIIVAGVISIAIFRDHEQARTFSVCRAAIEFEGHLYYGMGPNSELAFERSDRLGTGTIHGCNDERATELSSDGSIIATQKDGIGDESVNVYAVVGVNKDDAVSVEGRNGIIYISESARDHLRDRIRNGSCQNQSSESFFECIRQTP